MSDMKGNSREKLNLRNVTKATWCVVVLLLATACEGRTVPGVTVTDSSGVRLTRPGRGVPRVCAAAHAHGVRTNHDVRINGQFTGQTGRSALSPLDHESTCAGTCKHT